MVVSWAYLRSDGEHVVADGGRRTVHQLSLASNKPEGSGVTGVSLDPDGAVGANPTRVLRVDGATATVCEVAGGKALTGPLVHAGDILLAVFSPDGRLVATAARDRTARVWDAATGQPVTPPLRHGPLIHRACFSADGRRLLTTSEDRIVRVWDLHLTDAVRALTFPAGGGPVAVSPDQRLVAVTDKDGAVLVREAGSEKVLHGPWKLDRPVTELRFAPGRVPAPGRLRGGGAHLGRAQGQAPDTGAGPHRPGAPRPVHARRQPGGDPGGEGGPGSVRRRHRVAAVHPRAAREGGPGGPDAHARRPP